MQEEIETLISNADGASQIDISNVKLQQFSMSIHWIGVAIFGYALIGLLFEAWPLALLKPEWLQKVNLAFMSSSLFFLGAIVLIVAASFVNPSSDLLAKRAKFAQRIASWLAILYIFMIPLQMYAGHKIMQQLFQEQLNNISKSTKTINQIRQATTWSEVLQAYRQIPGRKPPLPSSISQPLGPIRDQVADALSDRIKVIKTEAQRTRAKNTESWLIRTGFNTLQMFTVFLGFAAIGRKSFNQPSLLQRLANIRRSGSRSSNF